VKLGFCGDANALPAPTGTTPRPGPYAVRSVCEFWRLGLPGNATPLVIPLLLAEDIRLIDLGSILSKVAGSKDCFRLVAFEPPFGLPTRNAGRDGDIGDSAGEFSFSCSSVSFAASLGHPHFCFLGMATRTPPQAHGLPGGQGQVLRGRPGLRTGIITRS
jgi:hypothetical protein